MSGMVTVLPTFPPIKLHESHAGSFCRKDRIMKRLSPSLVTQGAAREVARVVYPCVKAIAMADASGTALLAIDFGGKGWYRLSSSLS